MFESRFPSGVSAPETFLCAYGAAVGGKERDLQASARSVAISRAARKAVLASAAAAFLLGIAWPASVTLKAREDLRRLDLRAAELRPFAERHEASIAEVRNVREKLAVLQDWEAAPGLAIMMLKEITDRFPNGTWISSLRIEGRSVEMEGSPPRRASCSPR
jgi:Tfp pilus assembly protein PilN